MKKIDDDTCMFCCAEGHLLFECVVANNIWIELADLLHINLIDKCERCASLWLSSRKYELINIISSAILWNI